MKSKDTEVNILVAGKPVKIFAHEGKSYIQANKGSEYSIQIKNNSYKRLMFAISVDGINVISGKAAGSDNKGYIIGGYQSYEVKGFRTSNEEVHPFKFNIKERSYAAKSDETKGDVSNCGVIGIRVYEEKEKPKPVVEYIHHYHEKEYVPYHPWRPHYRPIWGQPYCGDSSGSYTSTTFNNLNRATDSRGFGASNITSNGLSSNVNMLRSCNNSMEATTVSDWAEDNFNAGTEFSKQTIADKVSETNFDVENLLTTFDVFYAFREGLIKMGVSLFKEVKISQPNAWPSNFCKPPRD